MMEEMQGRQYRKSTPSHGYLSPSRLYLGSSLRCIPEEHYLGSSRKQLCEKSTGSSHQISPTTSMSTYTLPPLFPRRHSILVPSVLEHEDSPLELVNRERRKQGLVPFRLSRTLNHLAAEHASRMAVESAVYHSVSTIEELKVLLAGMDVAENIQRGDNVSQMHLETMQQINCINRFNVLSTYFSEFGYGLALGKDGKVYCCQLFRS